jgi:DNA-binding phage protein
MANIIGDIAIQVGADIGPLVRELGKASGSVAKFGDDAKANSGKMATFAKGAGVVAAGMVAAGAALAAFTRASMDNIDALSKQARVAGVSVAQFQAMALVAEEAGVSSETLSKSLVKMQDNIVSLGRGGAEQARAFGSLGLSFRQIGDLKADEQFAAIAGQIDAISDPTQEVAAALDIFGKSGAEVLLMMSGYKSAVAEAAAYQREFGIAVSDVDAQNIEAANDAMGRISVAIGGIGNQLAVTFAPGIEAVSIGLQALIKDLTSTQTALEETLGGEAKGRMLLGSALYDQLELSAAAFNDNAKAIGAFKGVMGVASSEAASFEFSLGNLYVALMQVGETDLADALGQLETNVRDARIAFDDGLISAQEFQRRMSDATKEAQRLLSEAQAVDGVDLSSVKGQVAGLTTVLEIARKAWFGLRTEMASGPATGTAGASASASAPVHFGLGPTTSPRPRPAPTSVDFGLPDLTSGGASGGGGESLADELARMQERFAAESEVLDTQYQDRLAKLQEFHDAKLLSEQEFNELEAKIKEDHEKHLGDLEQQRRNQRLDAFSSAFGDMASLMQSGNEKLFKIGQGFAIAEAVIDGLKSATAAWRKGMEIGGPPLAAAFTAASLVKTGALIAQIKSQTSHGGGGGGSGGSGAGGGSAMPSGHQNAGTYMNFQFNGGWSSQEAMGRFMVESINEAIKNGATIKGARLT